MLDKAIKYNKEFRKEYRGSKRFDRSCRCHGGCPYCESGRLYSYNRGIEKTKQLTHEQLSEIDIDTSSLIVSF